MKMFKTAKWDTDASGDNTYEGMFKRIKDNKNKGKKKVQSVLLKTGEKVKDKKQKRKLKKLLKKQYKNIISNDLLNAQSSTEGLIKPKKKKQKQLHGENNIELNLEGKIKLGVGSVSWHEKEEKKKRDLYSDNSENCITKNKRKYRESIAQNSEVKILHKHSHRDRELLTEKKKLKKGPENAYDISLSKATETKVKNKLDDRGSTEKLQKFKNKKKTKWFLDNKAENIHDSNDMKKPKENYEGQPSKNSNKQINKVLGTLQAKKKKKLHEKLKALLSEEQAKKNKPVLTLRQKMMEKLSAARFRFLNEQIYTTSSKEAQKIFKSDPDAFTAYHDGYRQQVRSWPLNPLDVIIKSIRKMSKSYVVADFGCGDAKLAKSVEQKVHSFDLVAIDDTVVACDMSKVPLDDNSIDVAVFCLSLMGTNLHDYLLEANRVLKIGGLLKIAEVESRFQDVENFIEGVQRFGFKKTWKDLSNNLFYFIDFKKENSVKNKKKLPTISLHPCLYKKR